MTLSIGRLQSPEAAFTAAIRFLAGREPFASLSLTSVVDPVAGAIKRGHYVIASEANRVVGLTCWALTDADLARRWADGTAIPTYDQCLSGDTVVLQMGGGTSPRVALQGVRHIAGLYPGMPYVMVRYGRKGVKTGRFPNIVARQGQ